MRITRVLHRTLYSQIKLLLIKDYSLVSVEEQPPLSIPPHSSSKNLALNIRSLLRQLLRVHAVINTSNPLLNNRTLVQISSDKVSSGSDNLDTALVGLVVRLGALE